MHCISCCKKLLKCLGLWICFTFVFIQFSLAKNIRNRPDRTPIAFAESPAPLDTIRRFNPSLVLALTDTSQMARRQLRSQKFYQKLKEIFYQTRLSRELFDLLFVTPSDKIPSPTKTQPPEEKFEMHGGQIVGNIRIRKLALFGPTVTDTTKVPHSWLQKGLNKLHISTRERVIRKNLFIEKGDEIDPVGLADNERVLRSLPYIRDARIHVIPRNDDSDSVDILVLVQDVFPYSANGRFRGLDRSSLSLRNNNIAGLGHELSNELIYNNQQYSGFGYRGIYTIPNIAGRFIQGQLKFAHTDWEKTQGLNFQREFYTPEVRWAGGMEHFRTAVERNLLFINQEADTLYPFEFHFSDIWGAYAFNLRKYNEQGRDNAERSRVIFAGRFSRTDYQDRPEVSPTSQHFFHDNRLYMASIGWSRRHYYPDRYLFQFGRTEDVPYGTLVNVTFGREDREFTDHHYAGISLARGRYFWKFGYLLGLLEAGSFFRENWEANRRQLHLQTQYFSPLLEKGSYAFRHLVSIDYRYGDRRFEHEFLRIEEQNIRGFNSWEQRGTQKLSLRVESVTFTPLFILGFQFAGFAFADLSFLNNRTELSLVGEDFYAFGMGIRIRNENLTFNTFQMRFSIYPSIPNKGFGISISTIPSHLFHDFRIGRPQPLPFR